MDIDNLNVDALSEADFGRLAVAVFNRTAKNGGYLPFDAYLAKMRTFPTAFMEIVCIYQRDHAMPEILLEQRSPDDPYWPGGIATQGITMMARQSIADIARNHAKKECKIPISDAEISQLEFAGNVHTPRVLREHGLSMVYVRRFREKPMNASGTWYPIDQMPETLIQHIREGVLRVVKDYLATGRAGLVEYLGEE